MKRKILYVIGGLLLLAMIGATGRPLYYLVNDGAGARDRGMAAMAVRDDALATLTPADGDYVRLRVNSTGELWVHDEAAAGGAIAASGQHLDNANSGTSATTNYSVTVVASATYRVHATNGVMYLGIADVTNDANILWMVGAGHTETITIPSGTTLTYMVDTAGVEGRLARMQ